MAERRTASIDPRLLRQFDKARGAFTRGDHRYVIAVCRSLLSHEPRCLEIRRLLRQAQEAMVCPRPSGSVLEAVRRAAAQARLPILLREPTRGMIVAEDWLTRDPRSPPAHRLLGRCAQALEDDHTACFAFESWRQVEPAQCAAHLAFIRALLAIGKAEDALAAAEYMRQRFPDHPAASGLLKEAAVAVSLEKGRWLEDGDFRGKLARP